MANELQLIADMLKSIKLTLESLPTELKLSAKQVFATELSAITSNAGLLTAGEFRVGNGNDPGSGFTGVRMAYPPMLYSGDLYPFVSVNTDILQVGISLTDGKLYAGQGDVVLDSNGISFTQGDNSQNKIKFTSGGNILGEIAGAKTAGNNYMKIHAYLEGDGITGSHVTLRAYLGSTTSDERSAFQLHSTSPTQLYTLTPIQIEPNIVSNDVVNFFEVGDFAGTEILSVDALNHRVGINTAAPQDALHVVGGILVGGDSAGYASTVGLTNVTSGVSTGAGSILMNGTTARNSTGWLKIMDGTTAKYIPFFTTITG